MASQGPPEAIGGPQTPAHDVSLNLGERRGQGRPTILHADLIDRVAKLVANTGRFRDSCVVAGLNPDTAEAWRVRGEGRDPKRKPKAVYRDFADAITKALAQHRVRCKLDIRQAARGGFVVARKKVRITTAKGTKEIEEERVTAPNYRAAEADLRMEHPKEYPPPARRHLLGLDEQAAALVEQLRAVQARAHDPRALLPADDDVVDAEAAESGVRGDSAHARIVKRPVTD